MVYCYDRWQPRFDRMKKQSKVIFYKGLPPDGALVKWFKPHHHGILILDELMEESGNDKRVLDLFTIDSHHRGFTALYLTQVLFPAGKYAKTINRNGHYAICFKSPLDKTGIRNLVTASVPRQMATSVPVIFETDGSPLWLFYVGFTPSLR